MPAGDKQPMELLLDDTAWANEPVRLAEEMGHNVKVDHGTNRRWICITCDSAVLVVGTNIYGSALRFRCEDFTGSR